MTNRTPRPTDDTPTDPGMRVATGRRMCAHLDRKRDVQRVCVRDPHDGDPQHNMKPVTEELARALVRQGVTEGPGLDEWGTVAPGDYREVPDPHDALLEQDRKLAMGGNQQAIDRLATFEERGRQDLAGDSPPLAGPEADPTPTPDAGDASEPSVSAAGSGAGSGRPSTMDRPVTFDDTPDDRIKRVKMVPVEEGEGWPPESITRPDAVVTIYSALGGVANPAADPGFAITHAEEYARLLIVGAHFAKMWEANVDRQLVAFEDVQGTYRKMRQIAATHGWNLDAEDGGS